MATRSSGALSRNRHLFERLAFCALAGLDAVPPEGAPALPAQLSRLGSRPPPLLATPSGHAAASCSLSSWPLAGLLMPELHPPQHTHARGHAPVSLCLPTPRFPACGTFSSPLARAGMDWRRGAMRAALRPPHSSHGCSRTGVRRRLPSAPSLTVPHEEPRGGPRRPRQAGPPRRAQCTALRPLHSSPHCTSPPRSPRSGAASILSARRP